MISARRQRVLTATLVLTCLVISVVSSLGAPLIVDVARSFHQSLGSAEWTLTVTLLAGAVAAPILGRLGDGPLRKQTMVTTLTAVTAGGVLAAVAPNIGTLIVGRGLQGLGLGLVPLAMATAREDLPRERTAPTIAILSVTTGAGVGAGYPISGLIAEAWGVRGAYWFGTAACAIALASVVAAVPRSTRSAPLAHFDWVGGALLSLALLATLLGTAQGSDWGWGSARILTLLGAGAVLFALWTRQQLRAALPLVQLRLARHPAVLAGNGCAIVLGVAMYMDLPAIAEFVQAPRSGGFGFSASTVVAGLVFVPMAALMMAGSRALPFLVPRFGMRAVLSAGCLAVAAGSLYFALFHRTLADAFIMMGIFGIGLGSTSAAIPGLIVQAIPARETGSAMGFYSVVRYIGFSVGSALTAAIVIGQQSAARLPTVHGYTTVFWTASLVCVVAAVLAYVLPARQVRVAAADRLPDDEVRMLEETEGEDYLAIR